MLSIEEFNSAVSSQARRLSIVIASLVVATVLTLAACFGIVGFYRDPIRNFLVERFGSDVGEALMGFTPFPALVVIIGGLLVNERWAKKDPLLLCPSCAKSLLEIKHLVVATRNCGHCGKRVLAEPEMLE